MKTQQCCVYCGQILAIAFYTGGHAFCDRQCFLNFQVAQEIVAEQKTLHFTDDAPSTTEQL